MGIFLKENSKKGLFCAFLATSVLFGVEPSFGATKQMEKISRGLAISNVGNGMLVSWRLLGTESPDTEFNLYRDGVKIASISKTAGTNYLDKSGSIDSKYTVTAIVNGKESKAENVAVVLDKTVLTNGNSFPYKTIKLEVPATQTMPDGSTCTYTPNDMSTADLDGDGEYELILKWDPSNAHDNSQTGYTGTVFIDAYKLNGSRLWRIDLGKNIRAGAHYTQFQAFDYDGDGKAEMIVKTADGTVDGTGKVIGDKSKDYRSDAGIILDGPEYLTVFRGIDGSAITTVEYQPSRNINKHEKVDAKGSWGDAYGNRCERYLSATAYLDGVHPSAIFVRGYYTSAYVAAYDFDGKDLKLRWLHKSEDPGKGLYGEGNHGIAIGDLDGDGYDEIVFGAAALNHDGTLRYSTRLGHGDAHHLSDMDPDRPGLEYWDVHEHKDAQYTDELRAHDGSIIWGTLQPNPGVDNGRGMAADIDSTYRGFETWSSKGGGMHTVKGEFIGTPAVSTNFRIYFDGDLQDELLDGAFVTKFNSKEKKSETYFDGPTALSATGCNGTKNTPSLVADIFGDWREELVVRSSTDPTVLYIVGTPVVSPYRVYTLMHDAVYRTAIAWQNVAYNQPPHLGYYLPDMVKNLKKPDIYAVGANGDVVYPPPSLNKVGNGLDNQSVLVNTSIDAITYNFMFAESAKVNGLPKGVSAKVDESAKTITISGTPTEVGLFQFTVVTEGGDGEAASMNGLISVVNPDATKENVETKEEASKIDASTPVAGAGWSENTNTGFLENGYYNFENTDASYGTWNLYSKYTATTTITVRYANGGTSARNMLLVVNGKEIGELEMPSTTNWTTWQTTELKIDLQKGLNTLTLKSIVADGGANVDMFYFDIEGVEIYANQLNSVSSKVVKHNIFYNPVSGILFTPKSGLAEIYFYDMNGVMRFGLSKNVFAGENSVSLEDGILPKGMYVVKVKVNSKLLYSNVFRK